MSKLPRYIIPYVDVWGSEFIEDVVEHTKKYSYLGKGGDFLRPYEVDGLSYDGTLLTFGRIPSLSTVEIKRTGSHPYMWTVRAQVRGSESSDDVSNLLTIIGFNLERQEVPELTMLGSEIRGRYWIHGNDSFVHGLHSRTLFLSDDCGSLGLTPNILRIPICSDFPDIKNVKMLLERSGLKSTERGTIKIFFENPDYSLYDMVEVI